MSMESSLIEIFRTEADELFERWEAICLELESGNQGSLDEFFRIVHTLKGSSKAVGLKEFGSFVHGLEDVITGCIAGDLNVNSEVCQIFLDAHSIMDDWLESGSGDQGRINNIKNDIKTVLSTSAKSTGGLAHSAQDSQHIEEVAQGQAAFVFDENLVDVGMPNKKDELVSAQKPKEKKRQVIRVPKDRIDKVLQLIGELSAHLTIVEGQQNLRKNVSELEKMALQRSLKYLQSLEEIGLSLSMQPVDGLFQKLERACRDVARVSGKKISIKKLGHEEEIDKTILERLTDPLVHLVRNGVDHGIEEPNKRIKLGKPQAGSIVLSAKQDAGNIILTISDDGNGIATDKVRSKALAKGIITNKQDLDKNQILRLIFEPGFSTQDEVTEISGRGVGMDVVKTTLQELGGRIDIDSKEGLGTTFTMTIPSNITLVESIIIADNGASYGVPLRDCSEVLNLSELNIEKDNCGGDYFEWQNKVISLHRLADFYSTTKKKDTEEKQSQQLAILNYFDGSYMALSFHKMLSKKKLFVKPLKGNFEHMIGVSGMTILPDGNAGLVLNINEVAQNFHKQFRKVANG